jgi:hypothetical protein
MDFLRQIALAVAGAVLASAIIVGFYALVTRSSPPAHGLSSDPIGRMRPARRASLGGTECRPPA